MKNNKLSNASKNYTENAQLYRQINGRKSLEISGLFGRRKTIFHFIARDLKDLLKQIAERVSKLKDQVKTEKHAKNIFIKTFLKSLGHLIPQNTN